MAESKYDKAVTRATNAGSAPAVPVKDQDVFITKNMTAEQIAVVMNDPTLEFAPQIYKLEEGEMVCGMLEGNGPDAEIEQVTNGVIETKIVQTWILASPDGRKRISILSSVQLDKKLPPFIGGLVKIIRGKDENTKNGRRYTDYAVAGTKIEGKIRNWARTPQMIDASAVENAKQLTAGDGTNDHAAASPTAS